jgi:hypothetical protein
MKESQKMSWEEWVTKVSKDMQKTLCLPGLRNKFHRA